MCLEFYFDPILIYLRRISLAKIIGICGLEKDTFQLRTAVLKEGIERAHHRRGVLIKVSKSYSSQNADFL